MKEYRAFFYNNEVSVVADNSWAAKLKAARKFRLLPLPKAKASKITVKVVVPEQVEV